MVELLKRCPIACPLHLLAQSQGGEGGRQVTLAFLHLNRGWTRFLSILGGSKRTSGLSVMVGQECSKPHQHFERPRAPGSYPYLLFKIYSQYHFQDLYCATVFWNSGLTGTIPLVCLVRGKKLGKCCMQIAF